MHGKEFYLSTGSTIQYEYTQITIRRIPDKFCLKYDLGNMHRTGTFKNNPEK